jgi:hypothetical protein
MSSPAELKDNHLDKEGKVLFATALVVIFLGLIMIIKISGGFDFIRVNNSHS